MKRKLEESNEGKEEIEREKGGRECWRKKEAELEQFIKYPHVHDF